MCQTLPEDGECRAERMSKQPTRLIVNGKSYARVVEARLTLADFLRHELNLTGTHLGCDGTTVEGLAPEGKLSVLQQAFIDNHGLQCGFCTPGMLMTLTELLREKPAQTAHDVR